MKTRQIVIVVVGAIIILGGRLTNAWLSNQAEDPPQKPPTVAIRYVKVKPVAYSDAVAEVNATGRVRSGQTIALVAEVQGKIQKGDMPLRKGQAFKKGQLIYKIDNTEAAYNLSAQKSQFLNALAAILADLKLDYPSAFPAWQQYFNKIDVAKDLAPLPAIDDPKLKTFLSSRNILNLYYSIKSTEERLRKYYYYAPFNGSIDVVQLEPGSVANPGVVIGQIIKTGQLEIEVPVSADDMSWVTLGDPVTMGDPNTKEPSTGTVTRMSNFMDPATQSFNLYVSIEEDNHGFSDGQYIPVVIKGKDMQQVMEIPRKALIDKDHVYTVVQDNLLMSHTVTVVKLGNSNAMINGLAEGTAVVVEPLVNGRDSLLVEPIKADKQ